MLLAGLQATARSRSVVSSLVGLGGLYHKNLRRRCFWLWKVAGAPITNLHPLPPTHENRQEELSKTLAPLLLHLDEDWVLELQDMFGFFPQPIRMQPEEIMMVPVVLQTVLDTRFRATPR